MSHSLERAIGLNIRAHRVLREWTQAQLGERINLTKNAVSELERGVRPVDLDRLAVLCRVLDVQLVDLVRGADPQVLAVLGLQPAHGLGSGLTERR